jgi:2-dehydro-3-deoxyglucarate aldolase
LRERLHSEQPTFGSWIQFGNAAMAELMAQAGFDWVCIDLEHSAIGIETAFNLIQVIDLAGCVPLVRLSSNDPVQAKRVMDAGAHGIIVPAVGSVGEAEQAVSSAYYPPRGRRGVGLSRAQGYGSRFDAYLKKVETQTVVIVMIEERRGVDQIEEIVRVPGVDGVLIGPYDLSSSYGVAGQLDHPVMNEAIKRILDATRKASVAAGIHVVHPTPDQARQRVREGFRFIAYGGDMLFLAPALQQAVNELSGLR